MTATLTNIKADIQQYWTGSAPTVNNVGINYAVNDTVGDFWGGLYTVAATGTGGAVTSVTLTTAPNATGGKPDPLVYALPISTSGTGLTMEVTWTNNGGYLNGIQGFNNSAGVLGSLNTSLSGTLTLATTGIGSNLSVTVTGVLTGAAVGQTVLITPGTNPGNQFVWKGFVSAANAVELVVTNTTTSAAVATGVYYFRVF